MAAIISGAVILSNADTSLDSSLSVTAGDTFSVTAVGSDADDDSLVYQWSVPSELMATAQCTDILNLVAPSVEELSQYSLTVIVSDGALDVSASLYAVWQADTFYQQGDAVSHDSLVWTAKYWTKGDTPSLTTQPCPLESNINVRRLCFKRESKRSIMVDNGKRRGGHKAMNRGPRKCGKISVKRCVIDHLSRRLWAK
ncbi:carbohydrate-binding protein [Shewanella surugensis]|uniref:carbohydrate-binding protein n=1 Tax=Shewanella surugensis TaxID=212020 RepID=UPI004068663F